MKASTLLRQARGRAGLTLRELANATGVGEARISDYENDRHQPSVAMLQRLLAATGRELVSVARPSPPGVDVRRNAEVFVDVLSLADAMPPTGRRRPVPPTWDEITRPARRW
jgi:transcriptional regulator with XRE-family HTH domain